MILTRIQKVSIRFMECNAKDCLLTDQERACSRITWLVVCLFFGFHHAENDKCPDTQENGFVVITSIGDTLFKNRPEQDWGKNLWNQYFALFDTGCCSTNHLDQGIIEVKRSKLSSSPTFFILFTFAVCVLYWVVGVTINMAILLAVSSQR